MGTSPGSLASAIASADRRITALDDRVDAEDYAEWLWLRAHVLHGLAGHRIVLGTDPLTLAWQARTTRFTNLDAAALYLRQLTKNQKAMQALRRLAATAATGPTLPYSDQEVLTAVAASLALGRAWLIDLPRRAPKSRFASTTSPEAFAPLNPKYGTKVDFSYIAKLEGDQMLRGYVPFKGKTGIVAGKSGMTVASGFDLGQWRKEQLKSKSFDFSTALLAKILPYAYPLNFRKLSKAQVAEKVGKTAPVPELSKAEADQCDRVVFDSELGTAMDLWNNDRSSGVPKFVDLPGGWQTVWLSRVYQGQLGRFGDLAADGQWKAAIESLKAGGEYATRKTQEAVLLAAELPSPIKPPVSGTTR